MLELYYYATVIPEFSTCNGAFFIRIPRSSFLAAFQPHRTAARRAVCNFCRLWRCHKTTQPSTLRTLPVSSEGIETFSCQAPPNRCCLVCVTDSQGLVRSGIILLLCVLEIVSITRKPPHVLTQKVFETPEGLGSDLAVTDRARSPAWDQVPASTPLGFTLPFRRAA